jgi:hypothetical protein
MKTQISSIIPIRQGDQLLIPVIWSTSTGDSRSVFDCDCVLSPSLNPTDVEQAILSQLEEPTRSIALARLPKTIATLNRPSYYPTTWEGVRILRDKLLAECDWTQVADAPVDQQAWAEYRQLLRDLPQQFESAEDVVWPDKP